MGQIETKVYSLGKSGLTPISTEDKNNLPLGTVLKLNGYSNPQLVIVEQLGINKNFPGHGMRYRDVNLETMRVGYHDAYMLEWEENKINNRIQTYITAETRSDYKELADKAYENEKKVETEKREKEEKAVKDIEAGKELIEKKKPTWAKAAIIAYEEYDNCDTMTDYFNTTKGELYILAWSKHTRDLFPELRKAAANMESTRNLVTPPDTDSNGEKKTEKNKSWWTPQDEHREKWSMGSGYYLKNEHKYSTGWKIEKVNLSYAMNDLYFAAGQGRYMVPEKGEDMKKDKHQDYMQATALDNLPTIGEYKGHPTITLPTGRKNFSFGLTKAKAIIEYFDAIKDFVENNS